MENCGFGTKGSENTVFHRELTVCEARTQRKEPRRRLRRRLGGLLVPPSAPKELPETHGGSFGAAFGVQEGPKKESRDANAVLEQFRTPVKSPQCASGAPKGT